MVLTASTGLRGSTSSLLPRPGDCRIRRRMTESPRCACLVVASARSNWLPLAHETREGGKLHRSGRSPARRRPTVRVSSTGVSRRARARTSRSTGPRTACAGRKAARARATSAVLGSWSSAPYFRAVRSAQSAARARWCRAGWGPWWLRSCAHTGPGDCPGVPPSSSPPRGISPPPCAPTSVSAARAHPRHPVRAGLRAGPHRRPHDSRTTRPASAATPARMRTSTRGSRPGRPG